MKMISMVMLLVELIMQAKVLLSQKGIYPRTHRGLISQFGLEFVKMENSKTISLIYLQELKKI